MANEEYPIDEPKGRGGVLDDISKVRALLDRVEPVGPEGKDVHLPAGTLVNLGGGGIVFLPKE